MRKKKLGLETKKLFKQLLEKWEIEAEEVGRLALKIVGNGYYALK